MARGLERSGEGRIGEKPVRAMGVGCEVKGGDGCHPIRPAAASYFGHQVSRRRQRTAMARKTRNARPRPPTESHTPVTHFPKSVIGWMAQEHELNSADQRLAVTCCSDYSITRSPDQPISRSQSAPARTPLLRLSAVPGEKMNQMLTSKIANYHSQISRSPDGLCSITRSPNRQMDQWLDDQITRWPDAAGPHFPASVIGGLR